jgi:hypothetical protein
VLWSLNLLLQRPSSDWVSFAAHNIVGSVALSWVAGITYMLTVTLSVLQLREVRRCGDNIVLLVLSRSMRIMLCAVSIDITSTPLLMC